MNNITKGDVLKFAKSYEPYYQIEDGIFKNSLIYILETCRTYFLHSKPQSHILTEWEYNTVLYESNPYFNCMDLRSTFENYMKSYLREQLLNELLNE